MFNLDVAAQAEIEASREVSGTLSQGQHYYFKMMARKDKNGVRVQVKLLTFRSRWISFLRHDFITKVTLRGDG